MEIRKKTTSLRKILRIRLGRKFGILIKLPRRKIFQAHQRGSSLDRRKAIGNLTIPEKWPERE